jgi:serine/threonine-protein kinase
VEHELILGRYRPLAELGEGGHGTVTLAFDTKMARRVAIKRIPLSHAGVRRLNDTTGLAEARTTAMLNHPNIVTVHEWDTDLDEAFLIMEHVDGSSLSDLLDAYAPLDADEAAAVLAPICSALAFAHDNGVLHLDLKPDNVLVTRDGLVKVGDFGVASLTNAAGQAISAGGTLGYMPPEQLHGERVDARSDLWALGALSFEVLTGAVPFASDTIEGALYKAAYVEPPAPGEFVPELPTEVDEVLLAALAAEPSERYRDVADFTADLLPLLGDPTAGRARLAALVTELTAEDEFEQDEGLARLGLWDRLVTSEPLMRRVAAVIVCGWLGWSGVSALGLGWPSALGATAVAAAAAAFAPPLGVAAGLVLLAAGAFARSLPLGLAVAVGGALWWAAAGRRRDWAGLAPFFAPVFGAAGLAPALPLLIGFFMPGTWLAVAVGAASGAVAVLAAVASGTTAAPYLHVAPRFLAAPLSAMGAGLPPIGLLLPALAVVVGWGLAAGAASLAARRAARPAAVAGTLSGALATLAATGPWVTGGQRLDGQTALQVGLSLILVMAVIVLGPPIAGEPDE